MQQLGKKHINALKKLTLLLKLLDTPHFSGKEELAELSKLSVLSEIKGLNSLKKLKDLSSLKNKKYNWCGGEIMVDLFSQYQPINPEYKNNKLDVFCAYEEHYMRLLRNYKIEIEFIEQMLEKVREERKTFYKQDFPNMMREIMENTEFSDEAKEKWMMEIRENMEKSFKISETLITHYVTNNLTEFRAKMKSIINEV